MIRRMNEVTMRWQFGGHNEELCSRNPLPLPVVNDTSASTIEKCVAVLCGKVGNLTFEFKRGRMESLNYGTEIKKRLGDGPQLVPATGSYTRGEFFGLNFVTQVVPGEAFTVSVGRLFAQSIDILCGIDSKRALPIPIVSSKTFWELGDTRIPAGVAIALDLYMDCGFRKICETEARDGLASALRLHHRLLRTMRGDNRATEREGIEILLGKRDKYYDGEKMGMGDEQLCMTIALDGFNMAIPKSSLRGFGFQGSESDRAQYNRSSLHRAVEGCMEIMRKYGVYTYTLIEGVRTRHTTSARVSCEKLDSSDRQFFFTALDQRGCHLNE